MLPLAIALFVQSPTRPEEADLARLVVVRPGPKQHFREPAYSCPKGGFRCRRAGYVLPGDLLLLYERSNGYARVEFVDRRGRASTGWIAQRALAPVDQRPSVAWAGEWSRPEQRLRIASAPDGRYRIHGDAIRVIRDDVYHSGVFRVVARPSRGRFAFSTDPFGSDEGPWPAATAYGDTTAGFCQIRMRRLGPYLLVGNRACGGQSVWFQGAYRQIRWGSQPLPNDR